MSRRIYDVAPVIAVVLVLLACTWAGVFIVAEQTKRVEIERSYETSQKIAGIFSEQVARTIDAIESLIDFAVYDILQNGSADRLKDLADSGALSMNPLVQIAFVDSEGFTVATNRGPDPARTDLRDREHIRVHLDGNFEGLYIGAPVLGRVSGKWTIQISRRIIGRDGKLFGIIVASLDPFYFQRFWTNTLSDSVLVTLFRSDGVMLTRSQDLQWALESQIVRKDLVQSMGSAPMGPIISTSNDGRDRLSYFTRVPGTPLIVISGEDRSRVVASYSLTQRKAYAVGSVLTLILLTLGIWLVSFAWRLRREEQVARQAEENKSAFLAAMSHEIRTPLNALMGFAGLLSKTPLNEEQRSYMRTVGSSAQTLRNIVSDVLDFSKLESGALEIENNPFNLRECFRELEKVTSMLVEDKPIVIRMDCAADVPETVVIDGPRLYQSMLNVCGNAAKFTQAGEIVIRARVAKDGDVERLVVEVSDSGPGISEAAQAKLFTPFEQGEVAGKLRAAGTGLGLAISKMLLERMSGSIRATSVLGEGATFTLEAPFQRYEGEASPKPQSAGYHAASPLRILVADDARASRMLLRILLQQKGHSVVEAEDGVRALEIMQDQSFDLVFLDIQMPRLGGLDVARSITGELDRRTPMIVALSAQAQPEDKRAAAEAGVTFYITKPLREEDVYQALRMAAERKAPADTNN